MNSQDRDRQAVEAAIRRTVAHYVELGGAATSAVRIAQAAAARAICDAQLDDRPERPAEKFRRQAAEALATMAELKAAGRGPAAATIVAKRMAADPSDATEIEHLAQRFRRLWREREINERRSVAAETSL